MDEELFSSKEINSLSQSIATELANRNLFALRDLQTFIGKNPRSKLGQQCSRLYSLAREFISNDDNFKKILKSNPESKWISYALYMGKSDQGYDLDSVAIHLCMAMVNMKNLNIDEHVEYLYDTTLCDELKLNVNDDQLTKVSSDRLKLKRNGIIVDDNVLVYLHQFMRRYYSSNFVDLPVLLDKALQIGLDVYVRIDPLRKTHAENYREVLELDHWYGAKFSKDILNDKYKNERTLHNSHGIYDLSYDARFTVFRTKMMDKNIREFMIEEYCPTILPSSSNSDSPGVGDRYFIQKFAHLCYHQELQKFTHLDGAVRIFDKDDYIEYFNVIESGRDIDEKVGIRHKMFLVEGELDETLVQEILTAWFRYNIHIQEYFSGENIKPLITYEKLEEMKLE